MIRIPGGLDLSLTGDRALANGLTTLVSQAAAAILRFDAGSVAREAKPDASPVTAADRAAQAVMLEGLARLLPGIAVVSEEQELPDRSPAAEGPFVLVDPLDGTREYLAGRTEFTVNLGLIVDGTPAFGCIAAPALGLVWRGLVGEGAERLRLAPGAEVAACRDRSAIRTRPLPAASPVVAVSRSHLDAETERFVARLPQAERIVSGSSLKFCTVAEGRADIYPRLAPVSEWDIAAGHAIVAAAGGAVATPRGGALRYGRAEARFRVDGFVALGDADAVARVLGGSFQP